MMIHPDKYKYRAAIACYSVLVLLLAGLWTYSSAAGPYTFGIVPQYDQRQLFEIWKPLLDELQKRTGLSFRLVSAPTIPIFEKEFLSGSFDFAYMNPYYVLKARKTPGYVPLVRDSVPLRGILVVRKDSPIKKLSELNGKVVAFPAPNSLGASLLMRAELSRLHRVNVVPLYVKTHDSVYLHVVKGLAEAGGGVQKTLEEQGQAIRDNLIILYVTRNFPSHPVVAHPRVPVKDAEKVRNAFLEMAATEKGRMLLSKVPLKQPVSTSMDDYSKMQDWGLEAFWVAD